MAYLSSKVFLVLLGVVVARRVIHQDEMAESTAETICPCSATGVVDGVATGKPGCAQHSGQRFGYICYIENGANCPGARRSSRLGVYWRPCRDEHLAEVAKDHLLEAMEDIDMQHLQTSIRLARNRGVDQETLDAAEARVAVVAEMITARDELLSAIEGFDHVRLQAALEQVEELELDEHLSEEVLEDAVERFQYLEQRTTAENAMVAAMAQFDVEDLEAKYNEAARFHVDPDQLHLATERIAELRRLMAEAQAVLTAAIDGHDEQALQAALNEAKRLHAASARQIEAGFERLDQLSRRNEARDDLQSAMEGVDVETVRETLEIARDLGVCCILEAAENRIVELEAMMEQARQTLTAAIQTHDAEAVQKALDTCINLNAFRGHPGLQMDADARLAHLGEEYAARDALQAAIAESDIDIVRSALTVARGLDVVQPILTAGENRIAELQAGMDAAAQGLRDALATRDVDAIRAGVNECSRLFVLREHPELQAEAISRLGHLTGEFAARDRLRSAIGGSDVESVRGLLAEARALDVEPAVLTEGENRINELEAQMAAARETLVSAMETRDTASVQAALDECIRLFVTRREPELEGQANARLETLHELDSVREGLRAEFEHDNMMQLQRMIRRGQAVGLEEDVMAEADAAADRLRHKMHDAKEHMQSLTEACNDAAALQAALDEVERLNAASNRRRDEARACLAQLAR